MYYLVRCSSELAQLVPLLYSRGRSICYSDSLHDFSVTIPRFYKDVYVNSFFPHIARLWNSLPIECFPVTYDVNAFKPRITRYLLYVLHEFTPVLTKCLAPSNNQSNQNIIQKIFERKKNVIVGRGVITSAIL